MTTIIAVPVSYGLYRYGILKSANCVKWFEDDSPAMQKAKLNRWAENQIKSFNNNFTTKEKLKAVPVDDVVIIRGAFGYEVLKNREPQKIKVSIEDYLKI